MKPQSPIFKSAKGEARYLAAYDEALDQWPRPFDQIEVAGRFGCTHINAAGPKDAPPFFLLCGAGVSSTMWAPNVAALSRARRVYAPDTISDLGRCVLTQMPANGAELAEWPRSVFDELHIDQADVAGLSHGEWIALNFALTAPERVRRMILMDPATSFMPLVRQWHIRAMLAVFFPGQALTYSFARWNLSPRSPLGQSRMRDEPVFRISRSRSSRARVTTSTWSSRTSSTSGFCGFWRSW